VEVEAMYRILALYPRPTDPEHFQTYYERTHIPLAKTLPGLRDIRYSFDVKPLMSDASPYFCICELEFDSEAAAMAALQSPEGQAVAGDVQNYASGGITLLHYDFRR
jgi:uncharacterized protein (TIGR02118 family)